MPDMKKPNFEVKNINGRVPAIEDPNTGLTLWESGAVSARDRPRSVQSVP